MAQNELTKEQKAQLDRLVSIIIYYSKFSPNSKPLLVKIPFSKLETNGISPSEARDLVRYLYKIIDTKKGYIEILNGTIGYDGQHIYTMISDMYEVIEEGVDRSDLKNEDCLILWVYRLKGIIAGVETFIGSPISKYEPENISNRSNASYWIIKDDKGNYYYDGARVVIRDNSTEYMQIFNAIFSLLSQGGSVSYDNIAEQCRTQSRLKTDKKKIQRALTGKYASFFRYITDVPPQAPNRMPFFVAHKKGKMLKFNNQK
jgi:hypothetical protein